IEGVRCGNDSLRVFGKHFKESVFPLHQLAKNAHHACELPHAEAIPLLDRLGANAKRLAAIAEEVTRVEGRSDELHD
ncbi:hypothetical protein ACCS86_37935, partial [Rhizobium ruizarguesonis]